MEVLILVVVDNGLVLAELTDEAWKQMVLILVVVDNGLVHVQLNAEERTIPGLNPCCSGQWSRTLCHLLLVCQLVVLILVVVDNGLVLNELNADAWKQMRLNPCCSGQWSRTRHL